jgi:hypothetical protein
VVLIALAAAVPGAAVWWFLPGGLHPILKAVLVLGTYGLAYLALAKLAGIEEVEAFVGGIRRRLGRR